MGGFGEEDLARWEKTESRVAGGGVEERIFVSVRLRPLNAIEIARNDPADWECINDTTIIYRHGPAERSMLPSAYTFDRVFGSDCTTRQVYEDAAKEVALSVVSGINSSIFAYGQTSSGKTYTMTGITEYSVADIYDYINQHEERQFVLKFSAIEIYNEAVRDLLNNDSTPLRLLDDPERGTIVDKITEETLRNWEHLRELLSICEAQRQIGETSLNEMSSRSHQILRLTIESSALHFSSKDNFSTLAASVNFVDLAGSERASQALSAGARLKEGGHINRSLLTLGTVIRKLSKGRNGHIPYRDSKLTRILQSSLGGNARTAIICTMSPARSHMEQSRNTLLFATCAKEVVTSAQVNVVMSDKALVKHLQKELARLESELRYPAPASNSSHSEALKERDARIKKMENDIKELIQQRDLAQSRLEDLLRVVGDDQANREWDDLSQLSASNVPIAFEDALSVSSGVAYPAKDFGITSFDSSSGSETSKVIQLHLFNSKKEGYNSSPGSSNSSRRFNTRLVWNQRIEDNCNGFEDLCKEVRCIELQESNKSTSNDDFNLLLTEEGDFLVPLTYDTEKIEYKESRPNNELSLITPVEEQVQDTIARDNIVKLFPSDDINLTTEVEKPAPDVETNGTVVKLCPDELSPLVPVKVEIQKPHPEEMSPLTSIKELKSFRGLALSRSRSCRAPLKVRPFGCSFVESEQGDNMPPSNFLGDFPGRPEGFQRRHMSLDYGTEIECLPVEEFNKISEQKAFNGMQKKPNAQPVSEDNIACIGTLAAGLKEMAQKELNINQDLERTIIGDFGEKRDVKDVGLDPMMNSSESPSRWQMEFEKRQQEIIELWHACNVSLVHRTYFLILFRGDPADSIYMEVEHRRLSFLKNSLSQENLGSTAAEDGQKVTVASSIRNLRREREMLCRQMQKRMSTVEREGLYEKWGIALDSKRRRVQLAKRLWSETNDIEHVKKSASVVAKLIGLTESEHALKEMFGLSFTPQLRHKRSYSWKNGMSSFI